MENKKIGFVGLAFVLVIVAALSMGCIDEVEVTNELDELREQVADMEEQMQASN
jgi:VIT1/CCC1 family predicted Fe2+/Mn2+ transporter